MDEIGTVREVLLRACTGMANGPDIMAQYDAQSAQLATQAEELVKVRNRAARLRTKLATQAEELERALHEGARLAEELGAAAERLSTKDAQLTKRSAVVEAVEAFRDGGGGPTLWKVVTEALDALTTDTTDTGGEG